MDIRKNVSLKKRATYQEQLELLKDVASQKYPNKFTFTKKEVASLLGISYKTLTKHCEDYGFGKGRMTLADVAHMEFDK